MASPKQRTFPVGPFRRVRTTPNPYDDASPDTLAEAVNCYMADPTFGGGVYARPGTVRWGPVASSANKGQCVYSHTATDGTHYNFLFINGKVYRQDTDLSTTPVDVTPLNVTISPTARIYVTSLDNQLIVNDGENVPWLGSSLSSTPITATVIDRFTAVTDLYFAGGLFTRTMHIRPLYTLFDGVFSSVESPLAGVALPAGTIPADQWGSFRVSADSAGTFTITASADNFTTGYATEVAAIADVAATPAGEWNIGYFTVQTAAGQPFIDGTDSLTGGASGNPASATNYYAGQSPPWTAFGQPVIYTGAVFFVLDTVSTDLDALVSARTTITWSEPNQPNVGYQQTDYDNAWTLTQTNTEPLYALAPTNDALYYFRAFSIGAITGAPNINFQNTATHDVVSANVGCTAPATVKAFLNYVYFVDANGRPYRFKIGGVPEAIWLQTQTLFDAASYAQYVPDTWWGVIEPNLNVYLVGIATTAGATSFLVFDALTGIYFGTWDNGADMDAGGVLMDDNDAPQFVGIQTLSTTNHYLWKLARVGDGVWTDNAVTMTVTIRTGKLGYDAERSYTFPAARAIVGYATGTPAATLALVTSQQTVTAATASVLASPVETPLYRMTWQTDTASGRGAALTLTPTATAVQFRVYRMELTAVEQGTSPLTDW